VRSPIVLQLQGDSHTSMDAKSRIAQLENVNLTLHIIIPLHCRPAQLIHILITFPH